MSTDRLYAQSARPTPSATPPTNKPSSKAKYGWLLIALGLAIAAVGFYEISAFKEGEGSVWGLVMFLAGGTMLLVGIFRAFDLSFTSLFFPPRR